MCAYVFACVCYCMNITKICVNNLLAVRVHMFAVSHTSTELFISHKSAKMSISDLIFNPMKDMSRIFVDPVMLEVKHSRSTINVATSTLHVL